ncbi:RagB/SusD family nutrient uptake outer membrane protein [Chryseobacterium sp. CFS15]|uniref:RagB/SusD family nutrient uptake outer membrane protein n=1 Tax=Chryseobacterium sp. CFS15 TaxID=2986946 RepID=UPI002806833A|nr:RagB/SusD family nutrient uptake outer membrane protein [Chryseobacterium sp. CFS15]MDQ8142206.1 RagB/SusD family nutrient uptake outer membrane protein [Chryseobacterium sp. CFS15]
MKKIKVLLSILSIAVVMQSCENSLDIVQPGQVPDETIFQNSKDLEKYLEGDVYGSLDITSQVGFTSFFTDEVKIGPSNAGQNQGLFRYNLQPDDGFVSGIWTGNYLTINRVNRLLKQAEKITPATPAETTTYKNTLAEARVLRAFAYLNLMSFFTTDMKDDNALGVILSDTYTDDYTVQLPRVKNSDIWKLIEDDLTFGTANLQGAAYQTSVGHRFPSFASAALVSALRARMYLYRGNYPLARQYAQDAITASGVTLTLGTPIPTGTPSWTNATTVGSWANTFYSETLTPTPYRKLWSDGANGEIIFKLSRPTNGTGGNIASLYTTNSTASNGSPLWTMGLNLYSSLTSYASDIRSWSFLDPSSTATTSNFIIDKYPGKGTTNLKNDIKVARLSEMYLILAECAIMINNDFATAATNIRAVRSARRYVATAAPLPVYTDRATALKDILKERRVELCFEGHRYIDLRRLGQVAGVSIDRNAADDTYNSATPTTISITDHRFTLPIPSVEINGNPAIANQQNPGY